MTLYRGLFLACALLVPMSALADVAATGVVEGNGCATYTLCSAEADTTAGCDDNAGSPDNIVGHLKGKYVTAAYTTSSSATAYNCDLYTSDNGYSATKRSALTSAGAGTQLTFAAPYVALALPVNDIWAECVTAITGGTVTLKITSCPLN